MLTTLFILSLFIILILIAKILIIPRKTIEIKKSKIENAGRGVFALKRFYEKQLKYLDIEPIALAPWDPMGALAR